MFRQQLWPMLGARARAVLCAASGVCCGCTRSRRPRARWAALGGGQWRRRGVRDIREQRRAPIAACAGPRHEKEENSGAGRGRVSRLSQLVLHAGVGRHTAAAVASQLSSNSVDVWSWAHAHTQQPRSLGVLEPQLESSECPSCWSKAAKKNFSIGTVS